jgi:hypothetical protein
MMMGPPIGRVSDSFRRVLRTSNGRPACLIRCGFRCSETTSPCVTGSKCTLPCRVNSALNLLARLLGGAHSARGPGSSPRDLTAQIWVFALAVTDSSALSPRDSLAVPEGETEGGIAPDDAPRCGLVF